MTVRSGDGKQLCNYIHIALPHSDGGVLLSNTKRQEYFCPSKFVRVGCYRSQWPICAWHSEARRSVLFRFGRILLGQSQGSRAIERSFAPLCIRGLANEIRAACSYFTRASPGLPQPPKPTVEHAFSPGPPRVVQQRRTIRRPRSRDLTFQLRPQL